MQISHRRIALLTGASVSALGMAMPAYAAPHDALADGVYPGIEQSTTAASVTDTLTICEIATDVDPVPNSPCFFGVIDTTGAAATAVVTDEVNGEIHHIGIATGAGGDVVLDLINDGSAEIGAIAVATGALANAVIQTAILQSGQGADEVTLTIVNNDLLLIDAIASAGDSAFANANIQNGIVQVATAGVGADGDKSVSLSNAATISFVASAAGSGTGNVDATANAANLIVQDVFAGGSALANLTNEGSIAIGVHAAANGEISVDANAGLSNAIDQSADGGGPGQAGIATLTNNGSLTIDVSATATATTGTTAADANVFGNDIIGQFAEVGTGTTAVASAVIANGTAGVISATFHADANASGALADPDANVSGFINQAANGQVDGAANVSLDNLGSITLAVTADAAALPAGPTATPVFGTASANAAINGGIIQSANADAANASVSLTNGGSIDLGAVAVAVATGGFATANANVTNAISQLASATGGDAFATLTNGGTIAIHATATATGDVSAFAGIHGGIHQQANAGTTGGVILGGIGLAFVTSTGADAFVGMTNTGAISMTASAVANDTGTGPATAAAVLTDAIVQSATATGNAGASIVNSGSITLNALAAASAASGTASAFAGIGTEGAGILQSVGASGTASAFVSNSGTIALNASATAISPSGTAVATAVISSGIMQSAGAGSTAVASVTNAGSISLNAAASASGTVAIANATVAGGFIQLAGAGSAADAAIANGGDITIGAVANASATSVAVANAHVGSAIVQSVGAGGTASAVVSNSGTLTIGATAVAAATGTAVASALVGNTFTGAQAAINQFVGAGGTAAAVLANSGSLLINANATASASSVAVATGHAFGVLQSVGAGSAATASISNDGTMTVAASAHAAASSFAVASAGVTGASQNVGAGVSNLATVDNSGSLVISAFASASAPGTAVASAAALGVVQNAPGGTAEFLNLGGDFTVAASASAFALTTEGTRTGVGIAHATATGVRQNADVAVLANSGSFAVIANAFTSGYSGTAGANALGYAASGTALALDVTNSGNFSVNANAFAVSAGVAHAVGMSFGAAATGTATAALIDGTIVNSGSINVVADAVGTFFTSSAVATATGILMQSGINTATITNSGSITVDGITNGGPATANGIVVLGGGGGALPGLTDILTINNSGDLIVRESIDGGVDWTRGMAIDVALAPNNTVINLLGGGNVYGNVDVQDGDVINVDNGETSFDGIINPECMPPVLDGASSLCGQGTLNFTADGALFLRNDPFGNNMYDGPSYVFVETLNMVPGSTLIYELQTDVGGTAPVGTYPQIFADVANIDGNLVVRPVSANGLFDTTFWNNVIDANVRNGTFDTCTIDGFEDSVLLDVNCTYDALANVDLGIVRTAFDAVPGLTRNQTAVASGLECIFDPDLTGGLADVLADLFTFDATLYPEALDRLTGAAYASYLSSFNSLGVHYNDILAKATDCEVPSLAGSLLECRTSPTHMWAQIDFQQRRTDGDIEAAGYESDRWTGLIGFDMNVGSAAIVGVSIGRVSNRVDVHRFGDVVKAEGHQVGAYGVFDPGPFYLKAMGTYSWFDGDSERNVDFTPLGGSVVGELSGDPDVKMWTLGLHGGYRMAMGAASAVTPYLNVDYTNVKMQGFNEVGMGDVGLTIDGSKETRTTLTGGVKWAGEMLGMVPEVDLGYRYQFGDRRSSFTARFLNDEDCDFDIISEGEKRGAFLAGLSLGGKVGPVDVRASYQGLFNGQSTSHAGNFKLVLPLGGRAAPEPEPYVAPPPPPPPEEVAPPPPPPPPPPSPPPPPEPSGQRG